MAARFLVVHVNEKLKVANVKYFTHVMPSLMDNYRIKVHVGHG